MSRTETVARLISQHAKPFTADLSPVWGGGGGGQGEKDTSALNGIRFFIVVLPSRSIQEQLQRVFSVIFHSGSDAIHIHLHSFNHEHSLGYEKRSLFPTCTLRKHEMETAIMAVSLAHDKVPAGHIPSKPCANGKLPPTI